MNKLISASLIFLSAPIFSTDVNLLQSAAQMPMHKFFFEKSSSSDEQFFCSGSGLSTSTGSTTDSGTDEQNAAADVVDESLVTDLTTCLNPHLQVFSKSLRSFAKKLNLNKPIKQFAWFVVMTKINRRAAYHMYDAIDRYAGATDLTDAPNHEHPFINAVADVHFTYLNDGEEIESWTKYFEEKLLALGRNHSDEFESYNNAAIILLQELLHENGGFIATAYSQTLCSVKSILNVDKFFEKSEGRDITIDENVITNEYNHWLKQLPCVEIKFFLPWLSPILPLMALCKNHRKAFPRPFLMSRKLFMLLLAGWENKESAFAKEHFPRELIVAICEISSTRKSRKKRNWVVKFPEANISSTTGR